MAINEFLLRIGNESFKVYGRDISSAKRAFKNVLDSFIECKTKESDHWNNVKLDLEEGRYTILNTKE